ncbi:MAG: TlyA family RNA methyltransferase [Turicibacter sp.]|nr:TlyA family RNA methyltransferase [Turicibacter sp.]
MRVIGDSNADLVVKKRLDSYVAECMKISRTAAADLIRAGKIKVDGKNSKPSAVATGNVEIFGKLEYVSRGGEKLAYALTAFEIDLHAKICLDVGASTGGFTDCMLQNGASKVYAVENGTAQLHAALRENPNVISMENTDVRGLKLTGLTEQAEFAAVDVSFISLTKVLEAVIALLTPKSDIICLVKPQYEVGRGKLSKNGIVKNPKYQKSALLAVNNFAKSQGLVLIATVPFPQPVSSRGRNQEFLAYYRKI